MELYTRVELPDDMPRITHEDRLMLFGSCFATHMGERLAAAKFRCDTNPYGVLYNPASISAALREIIAGKRYEASGLFQHQGCWHSPMHHGDFSAPTAEEALQHVNTRLQSASASLGQCSFLLLTWGTAWVYEDRATGNIVGNCHKLPESHFTRRRLSVDEIVRDYGSLCNVLFTRVPQLKVLFTVSPIRHVRDGLHANQLSKSTLLLAADEMCRMFPGRVCYFPAYEIVLDELRDYRFYADDLVHPSGKAVEYVWQQFVHSCISPHSLSVMEECENINRMLSHKPFRPESEEYKRFLGQIVLKIERLNGKYPYLDFQKEREICHTRLNGLQKS